MLSYALRGTGSAARGGRVHCAGDRPSSSEESTSGERARKMWQMLTTGEARGGIFGSQCTHVTAYLEVLSIVLRLQLFSRFDIKKKKLGATFSFFDFGKPRAQLDDHTF